MSQIKLAILASGSGSNAEAIVKYFESSEVISIELILSNKQDAFVLQRANNLGVASQSFNRSQFYQTREVLAILERNEIDYIILAGFLWMVPSELIHAYPNRILNIHPSLLPKYGGKGMYGSRVHEAVLNADEKESGITIHLVDEIYDNGEILCQEKVSVVADESPESLAQKIHAIEHEFYPKTIESYILNSHEI